MKKLKYTEVMVGFSEVPNEISLCINISGCPIKCIGCHSPHLQEDIGEELKPVVLSNLIAKNQGITCVAFMGGDSAPEVIIELAKWVKNNTELKTCWYSGRSELVVPPNYLDFIKLGPYIESLGGLDSPNTNQKFISIIHDEHDAIIKFEDITFKFKKINETDNKSKSFN